ncbi:auxin response factor 23 [Artemisia annua]|uniref:Auxin response factor 23 n=1 Tax=Artemisia annua TaxID=35608 RepID=A0A2U1PRB7_ARTAN|nr:auxin response factor 23 [Artemisia annua]
MRMPLRRNLLSFCMTLATFDIDIHGGFSVLKRHTDERLPALIGWKSDKSEQPPTQDLEAKEAELAKKKADKHKLDRPHICSANMFDDIQKFLRVPDE